MRKIKIDDLSEELKYIITDKPNEIMVVLNKIHRRISLISPSVKVLTPKLSALSYLLPASSP